MASGMLRGNSGMGYMGVFFNSSLHFDLATT